MSVDSTVTLGQLITQAQYRADMANSNFVSQAEWTSYANLSYKELYDLLIAAYGNDYPAGSPYNFTTNGTDMFYDLPSDFYKMLGVDLCLAGQQNQDSYATLKPFNFSDRNRYATPNFQSFYGITNMRYRIYGTKIWLTPVPSANQIIRLWYLPEPSSLTDISDTVDGVSGWEEYIIIDMAMKALIKEESDINPLVLEKQAMKTRIEAMADTRDAGSPPTVGDTQWGEYFWPDGGSSGGRIS